MTTKVQIDQTSTVTFTPKDNLTFYVLAIVSCFGTAERPESGPRTGNQTHNLAVAAQSRHAHMKCFAHSSKSRQEENTAQKSRCELKNGSKIDAWSEVWLLYCYASVTHGCLLSSFTWRQTDEQESCHLFFVLIFILKRQNWVHLRVNGVWFCMCGCARIKTAKCVKKINSVRLLIKRGCSWLCVNGRLIFSQWQDA